MPDSSKYSILFKNYSNLFRQPPLLQDIDNTDPDSVRVKITLYFNPCFYGNTQLRVREWYDSHDELRQYRYCWEVSTRPAGNISSWENEHDHGGLKTNPHHHHYVPGNRHPVQNNYSIHDLDHALSVIKDFIVSGNPYDGKEI